MRYLPIAAACAFAVGAMALAPVASAVPNCTKTNPTTTQCETPGHAQITTSPAARNYQQWYGFPYGGFGGFGFGIN